MIEEHYELTFEVWVENLLVPEYERVHAYSSYAIPEADLKFVLCFLDQIAERLNKREVRKGYWVVRCDPCLSRKTAQLIDAEEAWELHYEESGQ